MKRVGLESPALCLSSPQLVLGYTKSSPGSTMFEARPTLASGREVRIAPSMDRESAARM